MYKNDTHQQVLDVGRWLKSSLSSGDRVGADPKLVSANQWLDWRNELGEHYLPLFIAQLNTAKYPFFPAEKEILLDALPTNLVDAIWTDASQPGNKPTASYIHDVTYAGIYWYSLLPQSRVIYV